MPMPPCCPRLGRARADRDRRGRAHCRRHGRRGRHGGESVRRGRSSRHAEPAFATPSSAPWPDGPSSAAEGAGGQLLDLAAGHVQLRRQARPGRAEAIAAQLYVEMLKAGYTSVAEFHYLHHDPEGAALWRPGGDVVAHPQRRARRRDRADASAGALQCGGFGGAPAGRGSAASSTMPTGSSASSSGLRRRAKDAPDLRVGIAPHSLRAVPPELLAETVAGLDALLPGAPIHIHIAEQVKEVEECIAWSSARPVAWLMAPCGGGSRAGA